MKKKACKSLVLCLVLSALSASLWAQQGHRFSILDMEVGLPLQFDGDFITGFGITNYFVYGTSLIKYGFIKGPNSDSTSSSTSSYSSSSTDNSVICLSCLPLFAGFAWPMGASNSDVESMGMLLAELSYIGTSYFDVSLRMFWQGDLPFNFYIRTGWRNMVTNSMDNSSYSYSVEPTRANLFYATVGIGIAADMSFDD